MPLGYLGKPTIALYLLVYSFVGAVPARRLGALEERARVWLLVGLILTAHDALHVVIPNWHFYGLVNIDTRISLRGTNGHIVKVVVPHVGRVPALFPVHFKFLVRTGFKKDVSILRLLP